MLDNNMAIYELNKYKYRAAFNAMELAVNIEALGDLLVEKGILTEKEINDKIEERKKTEDYKSVKFLSDFSTKVDQGFTEEDTQWFKETAIEFMSEKDINKAIENINRNKQWNDTLSKLFNFDLNSKEGDNKE